MNHHGETKTTRSIRRRLRVAAAGSVLALLCGASRSACAQQKTAAAAEVTPPAVLRRVAAIYPPEALTARREATVLLLVSVGSDGSVTAASVTESGGPPFDQAALTAVRQWKFTPARRAQEAVGSRIRVPFRFELPPVEALPPAPPSASAPSGSLGSLPAATPPAPSESAARQGPAAATATSANGAAPSAVAPAAIDAERASATEDAPIDVTVHGQRRPPSRGTSDYQLEVGGLASVPRQNASEFLKLAPGILLTNEGGEAHAEQVFLRGFDAREGQDIEFTVDGVPINQSGNLHGNGYSDTHFIIPEVIESLRVVEGPFDPRQGNYAVAGSAEYHLGVAQRGLTAKFTAGDYGTYRQLFTYAPEKGSSGTFAAAELYQTAGFGQNRDGRRGTAMFQYEGQASESTRYRVGADAYVASFHSAGVLREDDYEQGRVGFFGSYDPLQGEDSSRYSAQGELETRSGKVVLRNQLSLILTPLRLRENFTGFLLDVQEPQQTPHGQRGDLLDLENLSRTVALRGSARLSETLFDQPQAFEVGYVARGDIVSSTQERIEAATGHPYHKDADLDSTLGDLGLYADLDLRFSRWLALRGGVRTDLFTFDVHDNCAVQSVEHPSPSNPPLDASCISQQNFGAYREPDQRVSTSSNAFLPRASLIIGPFAGLQASLSAGSGVRSIDPSYVTQDAKTPFASIQAFEAGLGYERRLATQTELAVRSTGFETRVDRDLIFSQTAGRNQLAGATTRMGVANSARITGPAYDVAANLTYVKASFDDTHLLIPYVPDLVLRGDAAAFGDLPWRWLEPLGSPVRATLAAGLTYVGPRPLPYGSRSDTIFTIDGNLTLGWGPWRLGLSVQNLLDTRYRLGEFNYASDFHSEPFPTLVPVRHFTAGAPRTFQLSLAFNFGGGK